MAIRKAVNYAVLAIMMCSLLLANVVSVAAQDPPPAERQAAAESAANVGAAAMPSPHYFGPWPNYANSPFTLADVSVSITGDGTGAAATAAVGGNGAITGLAVVSPGSGYTTATVAFSSTTGTGAAAAPIITSSGAVIAVNVVTTGTGYISPTVVITGGGAPLTSTAIATAYGSVDSLTLTGNGSGYTFPTVDFDMPDDPTGVQATGHVDLDPTTGAITAIYIDNPGSGYASAPNVVIRDGTVYAPINARNGARAAAARAANLPAPEGGVSSQTLNALATVDATALATINVQAIQLNSFGAGYTSTPSVDITDAGGAGSGATAVAVTDVGAITGFTLTSPGSGYITQAGIMKFQDGLPMLCVPTTNFADCSAPGTGVANNLGQYIPIAIADTTTFTATGGADYYMIAVVQHRERMNSSLPLQGTLLREYVQLETPANVSWSKHVALTNDLLDGTSVPALMKDPTTGNMVQAYAVDDPHYLGPIIVAQKDRPVRITYYNLLPTGVDGNLFLPVDTTYMGSGEWNMMDGYDPTPTLGGTVTDTVRDPMCGMPGPRDPMCVTDNRATLHLHGGTSPWISDGTAHQWITPANENTAWPQGVDVQQVPDMQNVPGVPDCSADNDGCMTFYYTNQQSARLLFYHDHSWGITRLNVYAGEAAGYLITDSTEQSLVAQGLIPATQIPLVIQDKTFVPDASQLAQQDPTWDTTRWGGAGSLWYEHVYMPAQNPGSPGGMSAFGRWMYGPWFWPPQSDLKYGPIANPYFDPNCRLDVPATWQYQEDPFCEPAQIPGTPNNSAGMEQFNDTPVVNGTAYPTLSVDPKSYRFRILNAANDRFWNLQWYVADPSSASTALNAMGQPIGGTEVALKASEVAAAQLDPVVFPTPDTTISPPGPNFIQIGTEGGFLPAPVVVPNQPITWITDPTRFDVGNVDLHALLLGPAERADVVVDFSAFAGQTLILYNDAPAAFPARIPGYDYYTGDPDLRPAYAPSTLPGYGPNTRTVMQVKVNAVAAAPAFNFSALYAAFKHHANLTGVFESSQHPIIVGQAAYNSAYGTGFAASGFCSSPTATIPCDGLARIQQQGGDPFTFDTLSGKKISIPLQPKAVHDEMNSATFDEFGRMTANIGIESVPSTPGGQNINLMPFVFPPTELIDATNLPKGDLNVTPISTADGTQIWKITHNGVDTHPIHFHLWDVQVLNRVTWDNIIIPTDSTELGWKDTVRVSPLEDTIVALRPIIPTLPWEIPNNVRKLDPSLPGWNGTYDPAGGNVGNIGDIGVIRSSNVLLALGIGIPPANPEGEPIDVLNHVINFGWGYVWHCHILGHEEMDMMRPVAVAVPPRNPDGLVAAVVKQKGNTGTVQVYWNDNSIAETGYAVERSSDGGVTWLQVGMVEPPLGQPNTTGQVIFTDTIDIRLSYQYRVIAINTVGDTWNYATPQNRIPLPGTLYPMGFQVITVKSAYSNVAIPIIAPTAPTNLSAALLTGPQVRLTFTDNATNETGFIIERSTNGGAFVQIATLGAQASTGTVTYVDSTVALNNTYAYRVVATGAAQSFSNTVTIQVSVPAAPSGLAAFAVRSGTNERVTVSWTDNANNESGFTLERSDSAGFTTIAGTANLGANATTYVTGNIARQVWYFRIRANNVLGSSAWVTTGGIQPAAEAHSPLEFWSDLAYGLSDWSAQTGNVESTSSGLQASWDSDDPGQTVGEPAYVAHQVVDPLGSFMATFEFNPNGSVTSDTPVDIFTGLDGGGSEIFGLQYLHSASAPDVYQVRGWAKTEMVDLTTEWVPITNAAHLLGLDWQMNETASLNLYVDGADPVSVVGDTSLYQLAQERVGPSRGVESISLSPANPAQPLSFAQYIALSTEVTTPFAPAASFVIYLPLTIR